MKKILWISPYVPYDTVPHAGGQNHNYYLKYFVALKKYDIEVVSLANKDEIQKLDFDNYHIKNYVGIKEKQTLIDTILECFSVKDFKRDGGLFKRNYHKLLLRQIDAYKKTCVQPDIIIMQWTQVTLMIEELKKIFPSSKYVAIEEDVAFQSFQRKYEKEKGLYRLYKKIKYYVLKKREIECINLTDVVVVLNSKDEELLKSNGVNENKIIRCCSYYKLFNNAQYHPNKYDILFYGAMSRKENHDSIMWFIDNVMPKLDKKYRLRIVGANPKKKLLERQNERILIEGFVDSVEPFFESCLCMVAPLTLGAGIKIKVLEALSAGIPVITNDIGAEGIELTDGVNYIRCSNPEEYVNAINFLNENEKACIKIANSGREHVKNKFDTNKSLQKLEERISEL